MPSEIDSNTSVGIEQVIREQLMTGQIPAGAWVRESTIAERLGVSRTPVREAFSRISGDGLLEWTQRRGYRALPLDRDDLDASYPVLIALEVLAIERSTEPRPSLIDGVRAPALLLEPKQGSLADVCRADTAWHRRLVAGSGNAVLIEMHARMVERVARYIVAYWQHRVDLGRSDLEHARIAEALEMGDDELAVALVRAHRTHGLARIHDIMTTADDRSSSPADERKDGR